MTKRNTTKQRAPYRIAIMGEWLTLNRSTGQAYFNVFDPERGCKVRRYMGKMLGPDGELNTETTDRAQTWLTDRLVSGGGPLRSDLEGKLTVRQVVDAFMEDRSEFASRAEILNFRAAFAPLLKAYGSEQVEKSGTHDGFGPKRLRRVRELMIESGDLSRRTINSRIKRICAAFSWAAGQEMVPASIPDALKYVQGLRAGRVKGLREPGVVSAVSDEDVEAVLPHLSRQVAAIVQFMLSTGARCGEVVQLRPCDVDRSGETWVYTPPSHKTAHHGHKRKVYMGPKARAILAPWLLRAPDSPCFQPVEAEADRRAAMGLSCSDPDAPRQPQEQYTTASVRRSIRRACEKLKMTPWSPHQLRHSAATRYQHGAGWEEARLLLGHRSVDVTAQYAERDELTARATAERLG